ncbi:DUF262 domain-containing protein [Clostridium baratii]|uniref:DUF262 domain-containing protein n=1 Tax=Clostridium baratii TaxID=1561 RepID=UPI001CAE7AA8|nr:DUF262 domain-containing protein [Clostridium baratii]STB00053.1 Uncharacterized conserved protein [Clostridium baratii]
MRLHIDNTSTSLGDILKKEKNEFYIPINQRKYSWEEDQLIDYFNDLKKVIKTNNNHYMGVLTLIEHKSNNDELRYKVVDGQQRMLTTMILLCAIRDLYIEAHNIKNNNKLKILKSGALKIQKEYICFCNDDDSWNFKITPCRFDRDLLLELMNVLDTEDGYSAELSNNYVNQKNYLEYIVSKLKKEKDKKYINENIQKAYKFFKEQICLDLVNFHLEDESKYYELIKEIDIDESKYYELIKKIDIDEYKQFLNKYCSAINKFKVFMIVSGNESHLFDFFESLNTKGLKLSQMDVVRNYLFKKLYENNLGDSLIDSLSENWDEIINNTDLIEPVRFLKYFYMCEKKEVLTSGQIPIKYSILFEEYCKDSKKIEELIKKMESFSDIYNRLYKLDLDKKYWYEHHSIKHLGQEACYSFLMYTLYKYEDVDSDFCKLIFRYIERLMFKRKLNNSNVKELDELFRRLISILSSVSDKTDKQVILKEIDKEIKLGDNIDKLIKRIKWKNDRLLKFILIKANNLDITESIRVKKHRKEEEYCKRIGNYYIADSSYKSENIADTEDFYIGKIIEFMNDII